MAASRESIPANDQYLRELGRATCSFAYLEWAVVWLTETIEPGFLSEATTLTAGHIARKFTNAVEKVPPSDQDQIELADLARRFGELVEERNRLIHGKPYTAETGEQRLLYSGKHGGKDWTEELIRQFSDVAADLAQVAARLLHSGRYEKWKRGSA